jgi:hypothetical protein
MEAGSANSTSFTRARFDIEPIASFSSCLVAIPSAAARASFCLPTLLDIVVTLFKAVDKIARQKMAITASIKVKPKVCVLFE